VVVEEVAQERVTNGIRFTFEVGAGCQAKCLAQLSTMLETDAGLKNLFPGHT